MNNLFNISCAFIAASFTLYSSAACVFPTADGSDRGVSNRNLAGYYVGLRKEKMIIADYREKKETEVFIGGLNVAYTAFGGDLPIKDLKVGIPMRVWYEKCRKKPNGSAVAKYVEIFSNDIEDKPPKDYFTAPGQ